MKLNVRNVAGYCISLFYISTGMVKRATKLLVQKPVILSISFHDPSQALFRACIVWLKKNGFTFISNADLVLIANGQKEFPIGAVVVNVDDGWIGNKHNIIPIVNELEIPVSIFINTDPVEYGDAYWWSYVNAANKSNICQQKVVSLKRVKNSERNKVITQIKSKIILKGEAMTVQDLCEISKSKYITIGSHTVTHPILPMCSDEESLYEIRESKRKLESVLHNQVDHFAYPNGDFSLREVNYLKNSGYSLAFSTIPKYLTKENIIDRYTLPRFEMLEDASFAENICRMTGIWFANNSFINSKQGYSWV